MDSFFLALDVVLPLCIWMVVGYGVRRILKLDNGWIDKANTVLFKVFLPLLLFRNMLESDIKSEIGRAGNVLVFLIIAIVATFVLLLLLVPRFVKENPRRGVVIQGIMRSNTALYGIPVALSIFGQGNIGLVVLVVAITVACYNVFSVVALEVFRGGRPQWRSILLNIIKNPLIIAIIVGIVCNLLGVVLPSFVGAAVAGFAGIATPFSFFVLGAGFSFASAAKNRRALSWVVVFRLLVLPFIWLSAAILCGFRGMPLVALLVVSGPPTAVSSYPMASAMGGDAQLANEIVVFTSVFSILTMFLWVYLLSSLSFI